MEISHSLKRRNGTRISHSTRTQEITEAHRIQEADLVATKRIEAQATKRRNGTRISHLTRTQEITEVALVALTRIEQRRKHIMLLQSLRSLKAI